MKANGDGPNGQDDNCKCEFDYALRRQGVKKMITVVMDPACDGIRAHTLPHSAQTKHSSD